MFGTHDNKLSLGRDEPAVSDMLECALLSEASLAKDWNKPEEDEAWRSFQPTKYGKIRMKLSGNDINTVFALNRDDENSATYAFSWALSKSPTLLRETIYDLVKHDVASGQIFIEAQKHGQDKGFTDIEIFIRNVCHIIFEAKRYWELPTVAQPEKVVSYKFVTDLSSMNENWEKTDSDYFVYQLGPAMEPRVTVNTGNIYRNGRCWCMIDTLLSGAYKTISDARDETKRRLEDSKY